MPETVSMYVCPSKGSDYELQKVIISDDLRSDEIIVRLVATGICQTDFSACNGLFPMAFPFVGGHEGAGVVEGVGAAVEHVKPGDHVLLTYSACGSCTTCNSGLVPYCQNLWTNNFTGVREDASRPYLSTVLPRGEDGSAAPVSSFFFGQSTFAQKAIVRASSAVVVPHDLPMELLAPLGCGIQTGAGAMLNVLKPEKGHSVVIYGAGAVGMAAVMAARTTLAEKVIVVDIVESKLELAKQFGATHVINGREVADTVAEIKVLTAGLGADRAMDTTGNITIIQHSLLNCVRPRGIAATVGAPSVDKQVLITPALYIAQGISYVGTHQGDSVPQEFVPRLIQLWKEGQLPVDKLVKKYSFKDLSQAKEDLQSGQCIKAVLVWN
uniref:Enoyl reductase (ER) domain-containing protein n=1 Tax=Bionectria ochroleuca TaxID=29856 RepID=A0A8H7K917_BIOOC